MYTYKGDTYSTLQALSYVSGVPYKRLHVLEQRAKTSGETLEECVEKYLTNKAEKEALFTFYKEHFSKTVTSVGGLEASLREKGVTTTLLKASYPHLDFLKVYLYSEQKGYKWLLTKGTNFTYEGKEFKNLLAFYGYYKILQIDLFNQLLESKGNLERALQVCKKHRRRKLVCRNKVKNTGNQMKQA